jgi:hypothetical protein
VNTVVPPRPHVLLGKQARVCARSRAWPQESVEAPWGVGAPHLLVLRFITDWGYRTSERECTGTALGLLLGRRLRVSRDRRCCRGFRSGPRRLGRVLSRLCVRPALGRHRRRAREGDHPLESEEAFRPFESESDSKGRMAALEGAFRKFSAQGSRWTFRAIGEVLPGDSRA